MKLATVVAVIVATLACISLPAQQAEETTPTGDPAKVTYAPTAGGFGDLATAHSYEMSSVTCELDGKLDSKTAKVGDRVVLKTDEKVQTSDGTVIPRGTRLVGHVTEAQPYDGLHGPARIAIAFDHAELKSGQTLAVHTLIRALAPIAGGITASQASDDNTMGMPVPGGGNANGGRMGREQDGGYVPVGVPSGADSPAGGPVDRTAGVVDPASDPSGSTPGSQDNATTQGGGFNTDTGAHGVAAARAIPHPTKISGVMLAGNSTSSGVLLAPRQNIRVESGTQIELGVVADR